MFRLGLVIDERHSYMALRRDLPDSFMKDTPQAVDYYERQSYVHFSIELLIKKAFLSTRCCLPWAPLVAVISVAHGGQG